MYNYYCTRTLIACACARVRSVKLGVFVLMDNPPASVYYQTCLIHSLIRGLI